MEPDDRREQIVQVAVLHFARHGYDKASMGGIASDAGVTRALLYHYFPGKVSLFEAVLRHESDALLAATNPDSRLSPSDNIRAAVRAYLQHFSPSGDRAINLHLQAGVQPILVDEAIKGNHAILTQRIMTMLALNNHPLVRSAVNAWLDFVTTLSREIADAPEIDRESVVDLCMRTLQTAIGPGAGSAKQSPSPSPKKRKEHP